VNAESILRFLLNRPFERFILFLADGRAMPINHPEVTSIGRHVATMQVIGDVGRVELIDVGFIVSMRTIDPSRSVFVPTDMDPPNER
jgi:hypothetical protein